MLIKSLPEMERPVEKAVCFGVSSLTNTELLAIIIHTGTREKSSLHLAEEILGRCSGGISELGELRLEDLTSIIGIGEAKACVIMAAIELGKRMSTSRSRAGDVLTCPEEAAAMFMEELRYEKKEHFKSILVNARDEVISVDDVSTGELSSTAAHPREVFSGAVRKSAAGVILVHNHPSGDPTPSEEDIWTTRRLMEVGRILGIEVLDHIIIGDGCFRSLKADGIVG